MRTFPITAQSLCLWAPFFCMPPLDIGQFVRASIQRWDTLNYKKCEETLSPLYLIILKISLAFTIFFFLFFFLLGLHCQLLRSFSIAFLPVLPSNSCNNRSKMVSCLRLLVCFNYVPVLSIDLDSVPRLPAMAGCLIGLACIRFRMIFRLIDLVPTVLSHALLRSA